MFDWNVEELTNIIWGEAGDSDDHIVPYQEGSDDHHNKKEWSQEAKTIKATERKTTGVKVELNGRKLVSSSNFNSSERSSASGIGIGSWSDLSLSTAAETDEGHRGADVSKNVAETSNCNSLSGAVKAEIDKDSEVFLNLQEGKVQGDFVDYSWDNIGSFDDLDRIFSNDDPIFGNVSLGSADELWSSSKDVTNSPLKSFPLSEGCSSLELGVLKNTHEHVAVKSEIEQQDDQLLTAGPGKRKTPALDLQIAHSIRNPVEYPGGKIETVGKEQTLDTTRNVTASNSALVAENAASPDNFTDKGHKAKNPLKGQKKSEEKSEGKLMQDMYGTYSLIGIPSGKYVNQLPPPVVHSSSSSVLNQQSQLPKSENLQYQHISSSYVTPSTYGNLTNPYPAMPVLSHIQSGEFKHQTLPSCYEVSPGKASPINKSPAATAKPLTMTPKEKIEKLRRRQQLQAMLAIQKQQQQFSHQVSPRDHSNSQKFPENPIQQVEGTDPEIGDLSCLPYFEPNSPIEQDDSNSIYFAVDNYPVADTILYHLQDVIGKLDLRIRLCIRDSLFRLAQSSMQRHYASDTSSTNKSGRDEPDITQAENNPSSRYPGRVDAETETNPIDRTVAHLLFHRPLDMLGKHPETPESPAPTKFPCEHATMSLVNLPMGCFPESSKITENLSLQRSEDPCLVAEAQVVDQFKTSPCIDSSDNASNYGPADSGAAEIEASH